MTRRTTDRTPRPPHADDPWGLAQNADVQAEPTPTSAEPGAHIQPEPAAYIQPKPAARIQPKPAARIPPEPAGPIHQEPVARAQTEPTARTQTEPADRVRSEPAHPVLTAPAAPVRPEPTSPAQTEPTARPWGQWTNPIGTEPAAVMPRAADPQSPEGPRRRAAWAALAAVVVAGVGVATYAVGRQGWFLAAAAETTQGMLVLSSHPSGAQVTVDGEPAGATPLALRLPAGAHAVVVTGAAGLVEQFSAEVAAGGSTARHVSLVAAAPPATTGALAIDAAPAGSEVLIDGVRAGVAPLTVSNLAPGRHVVQLRRAAGTSERRVAVVAGAVTSLVFEAPLAAGATGWITVSLPFDVQVYEGAAYVGSNRGDRILVGAGRHTFDLVNESLRFRSQHTVVVGPGRTAALSVEVPRGVVNINAQPWAEVVIGGRNYGETPLANISLPLGAHEVTLRHPTLGERRETVTIRQGAPGRVSVDMR